MTAPADQPSHLAPSELGTKAYWDNIYSTELTNFAADPTDTGTVWFSESSAERRVRSYLAGLAREGVLSKRIPKDSGQRQAEPTSFLDLGTGNGHLLLALRKRGWQGRMLGVDYSEQSVRLAEGLREAWEKGEGGGELSDDEESNDEGEEEEGGGGTSGAEPVSFEKRDILSSDDDDEDWIGEGFDVVLDKGTFDAISLSAETDRQGRRLGDSYQERVQRMVKPGGLLVVVSCNWTEEELRTWLRKGELEEYGRIEYPSFTFGGQKGQQICTLCFRRAVTCSERTSG